MKFHRPSHRDLPLWITDSRDYSMPEKKRPGLFDVLGNAIGVLFIFGGLFVFTVIAHVIPDVSLIDLLRGWL